MVILVIILYFIFEMTNANKKFECRECKPRFTLDFFENRNTEKSCRFCGVLARVGHTEIHDLRAKVGTLEQENKELREETEMLKRRNNGSSN